MAGRVGGEVVGLRKVFEGTLNSVSAAESTKAFKEISASEWCGQIERYKG